jgi:hypothetical protein
MLRRILNIFCILIALLIGSILWLIYSTQGRQWIISYAQNKVLTSSGLHLELQDFAFSLPLELELKNVSLKDPQEKTLFSAAEGHIAIALEPLIYGSLKVEAVEFSDVVLSAPPIPPAILTSSNSSQNRESSSFQALWDKLSELLVEKIVLTNLKISPDLIQQLSLPKWLAKTAVDASLTGWMDKDKETISLACQLSDHMAPGDPTKLHISIARHGEEKISWEGAGEESSSGLFTSHYLPNIPFLKNSFSVKFFSKGRIEPSNTPFPNASGSLDIRVVAKNGKLAPFLSHPELRFAFSLTPQGLLTISSGQAADSSWSIDLQGYYDVLKKIGELTAAAEIPRLNDFAAVEGSLHFSCHAKIDSEKLLASWLCNAPFLQIQGKTLEGVSSLGFFDGPLQDAATFHGFSTTSAEFLQHPLLLSSQFSLFQNELRLEAMHSSFCDADLYGRASLAIPKSSYTFSAQGLMRDGLLIKTLFPEMAEDFLSESRFNLSSSGQNDAFDASFFASSAFSFDRTFFADNIASRGALHKSSREASLSGFLELQTAEVGIPEYGAIEHLFFFTPFDMGSRENSFELTITEPYSTVLKGMWSLNQQDELLTVQANEFAINHPIAPVELDGIAAFLLSPSEVTIAPARWRLGKEQALLTMSGKFTKEEWDAKVALHHFFLNSINSFTSSLALPFAIEGALDADFLLQGSPDNPDASLDIHIDRLGFGTEVALPLGQLESGIQASLKDHILKVKGAIGGLLEKNPLTFNFSLPLQYSEGLAIDSEAPLFAEIHGNGDLTPFLELIAPDRVDLGAQGDLSLLARGTWREPEVRGGLTVYQGHLEDFDSGTLLQNIFGDIHFDGDRMVVDNIRASDGKNGVVKGRGSYSLSSTTPLQLELMLSRIQLVRLDNAQAFVSGKISCLSQANKNLAITGDIVLEPLKITIPDQLPASVVTLDVEWIDRHNIPIQPPKKKRKVIIDYDIKIDIPPRAKILGENLASLWKGKLELKGTNDAPELYGEAKLVEGKYTFKGKPLVLSQGILGFNGEFSTKSTVHLVAAEQLDNVKIEIVLHGPLHDPLISFRSNPPLSQRDILSRLLFGKGSSDISPLEDTQLTQSLSSLSSQQSDKPGLLDKLRNTLPIDRIDISSDGTDSNTVSLGVGKYYKGILFSVKRDISSDNSVTGAAADSDVGDRSRFSVETELAKHIKLQAEIDDNSKTEFIIKWQKDY